MGGTGITLVGDGVPVVATSQAHRGPWVTARCPAVCMEVMDACRDRLDVSVGWRVAAKTQKKVLWDGGQPWGPVSFPQGLGSSLGPETSEGALGVLGLEGPA